MKISLSLEDNEKRLQYLLVYLCFLNTVSKFYSMYADAMIIGSLVLSVLLIVAGKVKLYRSYLSYVMIVFMAIFLQHTIIQGNIGFNSVLNLLSKFLLSYCTVYVCGKQFIKRFVNTTVFLSVTSLVCYAISFTPMEFLLRTVFSVNNASNWMGNVSYGKLIYHYMPGYERNVGIYSEPGVFQLFLCLALFWVLFGNRDYCSVGKERVIHLGILILTIITTASTAGYITMLLLFILYFVNRRSISIGGMVAVVVALFCVNLFTMSDIFQEVFVAKMQFSNGQFTGGTGNARLASILSDLQHISNNIWGYGFSGSWSNVSSVHSYDNGSSVGLTSTVNVYGIPISMALYGGFFWAFSKITDKFHVAIILMATFISSFLSQPWVLMPVYLMMFSYGFCIDKDIELEK